MLPAFLADLAQIISAIAALGAVIMGVINSRKIRQVHISINSRVDQLLKLRGEASKAEGIAQERKDTEDRSKAL